jgi:subtilisin family serine protease
MRLDQITLERPGQGVKVAIIDSGAAITHEDLRNITKGVDVLGKSTQTNNWMVDTLAHGSHCAGIIAGSSANKVGIVGFAPAAEIHVCKIFPGGQISQLIDALEYCIEQQIDVINLSLGMEQISEALEQVLARVASLGIAVIAAAGNSGGRVQYPASSPNVLAVAAIGKIGEFPPDSYHAQTVQNVSPEGFFSPRFTCFGEKIGLCAPGVAVLSSVPENSFAAWDGTSMAAPHVTGVAALVLAHHPDFAGAFRPRSFHRVKRLFDILQLSARPINVGDPQRTGFGMHDAPTALGLQLGGQLGSQVSGAQTLPQGLLGGVTGPLGQPLGGAMGSLFGSPFAGNPFAGLGQPSHFRPSGLDPMTAMYAPLQSGGSFYALAPPWMLVNPAAFAANHRTAPSWSGQGYWAT